MRRPCRYGWWTVLSASSSAWTTSSWSGNRSSGRNRFYIGLICCCSGEVKKTFRLPSGNIVRPRVSIFHVFPDEKHDCTMQRERRPQRPADGHTLPSAGVTRGLTRRRRPLSRRRSTTGGSVARRCYGDPKTSRRTRRKIAFGSSDWGGCVVFQQPPSLNGGLRAAKGVRNWRLDHFF